MQKKDFSFLLLLFCTLYGCSDSPDSSAPVARTEIPELSAITATALKYEGSDSSGNACDVYIAVSERNNEVGVAKQFLIGLEHTTSHGQSLDAATARFYRYDPDKTIYHDPGTSNSIHVLSLFSAESMRPEYEFLPNDYQDYWKNNGLEELLREYNRQGPEAEMELYPLQQFIRIEFNAALDVDQYILALNSSLERAEIAPDDFATLDQLRDVKMASRHGNHYDYPSCSGFRAVKGELKETTFNFAASKEDTDHEHGRL